VGFPKRGQSTGSPRGVKEGEPHMGSLNGCLTLGVSYGGSTNWGPPRVVSKVGSTSVFPKGGQPSGGHTGGPRVITQGWNPKFGPTSWVSLMRSLKCVLPKGGLPRGVKNIGSLKSGLPRGSNKGDPQEKFPTGGHHMGVREGSSISGSQKGVPKSGSIKGVSPKVVKHLVSSKVGTQRDVPQGGPPKGFTDGCPPRGVTNLGSTKGGPLWGLRKWVAQGCSSNAGLPW
jgi:hypothetical protein